MTVGELELQILMGSEPWIADDGSRPDGRWLVETADHRVTLVKRHHGRETYAFQPIDFAEAEQIAHRVIAGDTRTVTDPLALAALAAAVAVMGLAAKQQQERQG